MAEKREEGISLVGFIFAIAILALGVILALRVAPSVAEFMAVKEALGVAKNSGPGARDIRTAFNKQRETRYITSVEGKDLEIVPTSDGAQVSVAYEKRIELFGPVSLVIEYAASTADDLPPKQQ